MSNESKNYFDKVDKRNEFPKATNKKIIVGKDCLNKDFVDTSPDAVLHRDGGLRQEYERRRHIEDNRFCKNFIPQKDSAFSQEPPEKERNHVKMPEAQVPSNFLSRYNNRGIFSGHTGEYIPQKRNFKDKDVDNYREELKKMEKGEPMPPERMRKKVSGDVKGLAVKKCIQENEMVYPKGYKEPSGKPQKNNFEACTEIAKGNIENIKKHGKKVHKTDF